MARDSLRQACFWPLRYRRSFKRCRSARRREADNAADSALLPTTQGLTSGEHRTSWSRSRCDRLGGNRQEVNMSTAAGALNVTASSGAEVTMREGAASSALSEFERIYRGNIGFLTAFFARRCSEPQTVADLTSETIVRAAAGFAGFDPRRGTPRVAVRDRQPRLRPALRTHGEWSGCGCKARWAGESSGRGDRRADGENRRAARGSRVARTLRSAITP